MKKYIIYAFLASFIGIMANPEVLTASDKVAVTGISGVVETVSPEMYTPITTSVVTEVPVTNGASLNTGVATPVTPVVLAPATSVISAPANSVTIAGQAMETEAVSVVKEDIGSGVYAYKNRYFYAHNPGKFTVLTEVKVGDAITVTTGGAARTYRVAEIAEYTLDELRMDTTKAVDINGRKVNTSVMGAIQLAARNEKSGQTHAIALQTCLGEGKRLMVFAD